MYILKAHPEIYSAFIERYNTLYHFRKNLSVALALFVLTVVAFGCLSHFVPSSCNLKPECWEWCVWLILPTIGAVVAGISAKKTLESFNERVNAAYEYFEENKPKSN